MSQPIHPLEHGQSPLPPDLIAAAGGWAEGELAVVLPTDQNLRWRGGVRVLVEDYLRLVPALRRNDQVVLALIRNELALREELGDHPRPEEYRDRFPHLWEQVAAQFTFRMAAPDGTRTFASPDPAGPGPQASGTAQPVPPRLGRYVIKAEISRGGFGVVYLGRDESLGREIAVKVPHRKWVPTPRDGDAFLAEARVLAQLDHPGIVPVYDFGRTDDGLYYLVSKYVPGGSLADRIRAGGLSHTEAAGLVAAVADALHHAHQRGLVHRDVKPANVLLEPGGRPVLADFGLALREEDYGRVASTAGTPAYMSPEQARGEGHLVDARTDVYSLGVVLYELLTGRSPFPGRDQSELLELVKGQDPRPPRQLDDSIPRELDRVCLKAMAKRAADRYSTARDLAEDLRQWLALQPLGWPAESPRPVPSPAEAAATATIVEPPGGAVVPRGLRSFEAEDADFFLDLLPGPRARGGVPESVRFWKSLLEERDDDRTFRVGVLYGPSGCGKSSLVKAGVLPRLARHVEVVYVEATAEDTEAHLARGLRKRWPGLPVGPGMGGVVAGLRRGHGPPAGTKVVIVFDQFEQWLHAHPSGPGPGLVDALRQCDGGRVQALLLVRDDFWMAVTRFLREVEVPLLEGRNAAAVDLFDPRHARKVLAAFGRAYGALPAGTLAPEHERFLDRAVAGLAEGGAVVPVRLSLFAEMVKGKPWTPATWRAFGGAEGVGVAFLEETFAAPRHRAHQRAARAVLKALLPDPGADLKGPMRSRAELAEVSGYARQPREFDDLLRALDAELRLVTATDREAADSGATLPDDVPRYYQLTHDYLVPALRQWLTRKQRETRRGRAELRLADRAAVWAGKPENRHLPSAAEWARIRLLTRERDWTPPQRAMMRRAARYHAAWGVVLAAVLALLGWGAWEYHARQRAYALRDQLLVAAPADVPRIVEEMTPYRRRVDSLLREARDRAEVRNDPARQLRLSLALLPSDPGQVGYLYGRLLDARPEEFAVVRGQLAPHQEELTGRLWAELEDRTGRPDQRLRAACALATYAPEDPRWSRSGKDVAGWLVAENPLALVYWKDTLQPAGGQLLAPLADLLADGNAGPSQRRTVTELYRAFAAGRDDGFAALEGRLSGEGPPDASGEASVNWAKGRANVAAALAVLGRPEKVWPLFVHSPDPTVRSYLIERLGSAGADPKVLERRLDVEPDTSARRALILALGGFRPDHLPSAEKKLLHLYLTDPDPGIHAAAGWVLRNWERGQQLPEFDGRFATGRVQGGRRWYVNKEGQTFTVIEKPGTFRTGEGQPVRRIDHSFAIASREVTVREFRRFREDHQHDATWAPTPDRPVNKVSWYQAAEYCNWLSKQDGIPEDEWCYRPNAAGRYEEGMTVAPHYLIRTGYRLPTEAEWEFACWARARTRFAYGAADEELLGRYAWWYGNSHVGRNPPSMHTVGILRPNDFGLFDTDGNASEWCQDRYSGGPDGDGAEEVTEDVDRVLRGGSVIQSLAWLGWGSRSQYPSNLNGSIVGFRPVRTLR